MFRFLLAPRWLALHAAAVALVVGFTALGWWQLDVYRDNSARQDLRELPAVPLTDLARPGDPLGDAADRAVTAAGSYVADLVVPARVHNGTLGAYAAGVLQTDSGQILVLRGWQHRAAEIAPVPRTPVTVSGHVVAPELAVQATGGSRLESGQLGYLAPEAAAEAAGLDRDDLYAGYLIVTDERPPPAAPPERLDVDTVAPIRDVNPWQNLSYWAQWWLFAGAVLVFWASFVRAGVRNRRSPAPDPDAPAEPAPRPSAPRRTTSAG
ncbi:MAG TPA: SURF1 family cytochrome oxidase biogenesis protein [Jiangellaceae bacterium]|nr:SURF1 family cytochrome oxidase biogenesis protein [Jiangellaceae bacterium]